MVARLLPWLLAALVVSVSATNWRDLINPPSLTVSHNATGVLRVGDVVQLSCTSHGMAAYNTLRWTRAHDYIREYEYPRGLSPLVHTVVVTAALHGAEFFCSAPYTESNDETHEDSWVYHQYTIHSERVKLQVEGGTNIVLPNRAGRAVMTSAPAAAEHREHDVVAYTCTAQQLVFPVVGVIIAKGDAEIQLHSGWQPARTLALNLTRADHGARVFCVVSNFDASDFTTYELESNHLPITILP